MLFFRPAKWLKKKIVIHFHSFSPDTTINGSHSNLYKYIFSNADAVIVLSNYWKEVVDSKYNLGDKIRVIYNPCPRVDNTKSNTKKKQILYAGTLNQRKGYADLIKSFSSIALKYPDWNIVLAGNGETDKAKRLSVQYGIEKQVRLLGWVDGDRKELAYKESSVFCLPSYAEGFPMAVLDAWAYGLPVITTPVGGIPDIAKDGENMLLFNPGDIDKLSACLESVISDEKLRERLSDESNRLSAKMFNINTITAQVGKLYEELIGE